MIVQSVEEGLQYVEKYPVLVQPKFTLGGKGTSLANNKQDLIHLLQAGLSLSPVGEVLLEMMN